MTPGYVFSQEGKFLSLEFFSEDIIVHNVHFLKPLLFDLFVEQEKENHDVRWVGMWNVSGRS